MFAFSSPRSSSKRNMELEPHLFTLLYTTEADLGTADAAERSGEGNLPRTFPAFIFSEFSC